MRENSVVASTWGFETSACYERPAFTAPTPLVRDPRSVIGSLQPEFKDHHFGFLLCVGPGVQSSSRSVSRHQINDALLAMSSYGSPMAPRRANARTAGSAGRHGHIPANEARPDTKGLVQDGSKASRQKSAGTRKNKAVRREDGGELVSRGGGKHGDDGSIRESEKSGRMKQRQLRAPRKMGSRFAADMRRGSH